MNTKIKEAIHNLIEQHQKDLWNPKKNSLEIILKNYSILTKFDLFYILKTDEKLDWEFTKDLKDFFEFQKWLEKDQDLNKLVNQFLNNHLLHYAGHAKNKEILESFKESIYMSEGTSFEFDFSGMTNFKKMVNNDINDFSVNVGKDNDIEEENEKEYLKDIETY